MAGSIGPTGELMAPMGALTFDTAVAAFAEQAAALAAGGVDLFVIETMSDLEEVQGGDEGCRQASDLPIAATMTFDTNYHTMMGVHPAAAVKTLAELGVSIIGANCGNGPDEIRRWSARWRRPGLHGVFLMAQSNAGLPKYTEGQVRYDGTPAVMADYALRDGGAGREHHRRLLRQHALPTSPP